MDFNVLNAWSWLGYIVHDYTGYLISLANGLGDRIRGAY